MQPEAVAKISLEVKSDEICLRAVSLLKNIINSSWNMAGTDDQNDKENVNSN
jgi:hypothetical protein